MKVLILSIVLSVIGIGASFAQNTNNDPQVSVNNYKHANKAKIAKQQGDSRQSLKSAKVALRNQKTNKSVTRDYVLAPNNNTPAYNVQGKKVKANYKSQF
jgi:hypothetical protein